MNTTRVCEEYFGGCPQCGEASWLNVAKRIGAIARITASAGALVKPDVQLGGRD